MLRNPAAGRTRFIYYTHIEQIQHNMTDGASLEVPSIKSPGMLALICKAALRGEIFPMLPIGILMQMH